MNYPNKDELKHIDRKLTDIRVDLIIIYGFISFIGITALIILVISFMYSQTFFIP